MQELAKKPGRGTRRWVHTVTTVSTAPPPGLFTKNARTIARALASKRVSPKGITSGLRMLLFFINRAGLVSVLIRIFTAAIPYRQTTIR